MDVAGTLGRKYGPLPGWAWMGSAAVATVIIVRRRRAAAAANPPSASGDAAAADTADTSGPDYTTGYAEGFGDGIDYGGTLPRFTQSKTAPRKTSKKPPAKKHHKRPPPTRHPRRSRNFHPKAGSANAPDGVVTVRQP